MQGERENVPFQPSIFLNTFFCVWVQKLLGRNNCSLIDERIVLVLAYGYGKERERKIYLWGESEREGMTK